MPFEASERVIRISREVFGTNVAVYQLEHYRLFQSLGLRGRLPCSPAFIRSWHNHFDNCGNFMPGYCGGISLGECRKLDELLSEGIELDSRPILSYIVADNFDGLLEFAREHGYRERPAGYLSKCHLCVDLRRHLARSGGFAELQPAARAEAASPRLKRDSRPARTSFWLSGCLPLCG